LLQSNFSYPKPTQISEFGRFYFKIAKYLLGNSLNKKRPLQPLTYAFTDYEGSRNGSSDADRSLMPHIHALMLVRPEHLRKFHFAIFNAWMPSIRDIQFKPYSPTKGTLENLVAYCMKGYVQQRSNRADREDLWAIFPK
jgi:hypothetical protein